MDEIDDVEHLQRELLMADLKLRRKQDIWETPRNIAILIGATVVLSSAIGGFIGYWIGSTPPAPIVIHLQHD